MAVINVYGVGDIDYETNGAGILLAMDPKVHEVAGGLYELTLTHPVDPMGIWRLLVPGNIFKCSVPAQGIDPQSSLSFRGSRHHRGSGVPQYSCQCICPWQGH